MDIISKIRILSGSAKWDTCASTALSRTSLDDSRIGNAAKAGICHSFSQDGRCISLFKTLLTNRCTHDCRYCTNRSCSNRTITEYEPEQLANVFMNLYIRNYVEGLFLSSGIDKSPDFTTEKMLDVCKILRTKYRFQGYIHLKILPGTSIEHIKQASEIADRLSINLEVPNKIRMSEICSVKDYHIDILRRQRWISNLKIPSGQTTQFVLGGSNETDLEIIRMINWEYKNFDLKRAYYSAFTPVPNTPLENQNMTPLKREHRLYNIDFMMRLYGITLNEIKDIMCNGMLPSRDPKISLAENYFDGPIDLNTCSYDEMIRVPGVGKMSADRIQKLRVAGKMITKEAELHNMGVVLKRARPFIKMNGYTQKRVGDFCA